MSDLKGKRALVTGGSRGIGAAIAFELAARGAHVAITYEKSSERADAVVKEIQRTGGHAFAIKANSADADAVKRSVAEAADCMRGLDILVNNAGIARMGPLADMSLNDIDALLHINVRAVIVASQVALSHLGRGGRIITIGSSNAERVPTPGLTAYALTKSSLLAFTRGLARELGAKEITVNLVQPGPIDTDMNPAVSDWAQDTALQTALGRYGKPSDIAAAVSYLASSAANYVTGSVLTVDGGYTA